jgi:hypothetical protein
MRLRQSREATVPSTLPDQETIDREACELRQLHQAAESAGELIAVLCKLQELAGDGITISPKSAAHVALALLHGAEAFEEWAQWLQAGCPS